MSDAIVSEELALLERVREHLAARSDAPPPAEEPLVRELERLREQLLARGETSDGVALREQWHRYSALLQQLRASDAAPRVDPDSPYFAHLRLEEEGVQRDLCLGRASCVERGVRIVDWRNAPISRIFYRYQQGDEYEEHIAGRERSGQVAVRRTVAIRDGTLERVEAPEGVFTRGAEGWRRRSAERPRLVGGEATALRARDGAGEAAGSLGRGADGVPLRADKHLPEITSLIDPAQFALITRPAGGFLAIRGGAGSGKTTVALHRIAYLAYDDASMDSRATLFIAFSRGLCRYVSHVLPALGVERVGVVTFAEWAGEQRRRHFPQLPGGLRHDAPAEVQRLKLHPALAGALAAQVARTPGEASIDQAIDDWASVLTDPALLEETVEAVTPGAFRPGAIRRATEWCRRRNEELFAWMAGEPEVEAELEPEDDALLLRAHQLRVGPLGRGAGRALRYRHLAIDEVQDFAPLEVQVLIDTLDRRRSLTLAGDTQQHVMAHSGFTSWSEFLSRLGLEGAEVETLRISYRSSEPIVGFARGVLGALSEDDEPPVVTRTGPPVELFRFTDRGAEAAFLVEALGDLARREPLASVAVLTPSPEVSAAYHAGLARGDLPRLHRVESQDFRFQPGVEVTEIEQAKGLEFDYVVLVNVDAEHYPDRDEARRRLHVGATRAVHQLWLTCSATASPLVAGLVGEG